MKIRKFAMIVLLMVFATGMFSMMTEAAGENIASGVIDEEYGQIQWEIDDTGKLIVTGIGDVNQIEGYNRMPWDEYRKEILSAEINVTGLTDASYMFFDCYNLKSVDFTSFDTSQVTDMTGMFEDCQNLKNINLSSFNTSQVTWMYGMFWDCRNLQSLDLSGFDISNVEYMRDMFSDCNSLEQIKSPLNCSVEVELPTVSEDDKWYLSDGTVITHLPQNLTESVTITKNRIPRENIAGGVIDEEYGQITWEIDNEGHLTVTGTGDVSDTVGVDVNRAPWSDYKDVITSAEINVTEMKNASCLFYECEYLEKVDLSNFDTSCVEDMSYMFYCCFVLKDLDVTGFDTSNVKNMSGIFYGCEAVEILDVSGFDTSNVMEMNGMFGGCESVNNLDVSSFDTSQVTSMVSMFWSCRKLKTLDVSSFDTSNVTNMRSMFDSCISMMELDLSSFNTRNVQNMSDMFYYCPALERLNLSSFDMRNVEKATSMFLSCRSLEKIHTAFNCWLSIELPIETTNDKWYLSDGTIITHLPQGLTESVTITKNIPVTKAFTDIKPGQWYIDAVQYVFDNGIMGGSKGAFNPNGNISREQVIATLYNMENSPKVDNYAAVNALKDLKAGQWYTDAICWAYNLGVAQGNASTKMFGIGNPITREQLATMLYNYAAKKEYDTETRKDYSALKGAKDVSSYAVEVMQWAYGTGLIGGNNNLNPKGYTTRAQMASILMNFRQKNNI